LPKQRNMSEPNKISQAEIDEINHKLLSYITGRESSSFEGEEEEPTEDSDPNDWEYVDDTYNDIDFSQFKGEFKSNIKGVQRIASKKKPKKRAVRKKGKLTKRFTVGEGEHATIHATDQKKIARVLVPRDKTVIVEGVSKFILSGDAKDNTIKNVGYHNGKKLQELVLTFNNNSALDFNLELFNPSEPLDYTQSTSLNLNDKVQVAGGGAASYTDVLFNILANPPILFNAKFTFSGPRFLDQINQPLIFKNKRISGDEKIEPMQLQLQVDTMQVQQNIVFWDIVGNLKRPYIPDGMDVIQYKVLAGNTVTFAFYYRQAMIKKMFYKELQKGK